MGHNATPQSGLLTNHTNLLPAGRQTEVFIANVNNTGANGEVWIGRAANQLPGAVRNAPRWITVEDFDLKYKIKPVEL